MYINFRKEVELGKSFHAQEKSESEPEPLEEPLEACSHSNCLPVAESFSKSSLEIEELLALPVSNGGLW